MSTEPILHNPTLQHFRELEKQTSEVVNEMEKRYRQALFNLRWVAFVIWAVLGMLWITAYIGSSTPLIVDLFANLIPIPVLSSLLGVGVTFIVYLAAMFLPLYFTAKKVGFVFFHGIILNFILITLVAVIIILLHRFIIAGITTVDDVTSFFISPTFMENLKIVIIGEVTLIIFVLLILGLFYLYSPYLNISLLLPHILPNVLFNLPLATFDEFVDKAFEKTKSFLQTLSPITLQQLKALVDARITYLDTQVQNLSAIVGAVTLISLVTLFVSQEAINTTFTSINTWQNDITQTATAKQVGYIDKAGKLFISANAPLESNPILNCMGIVVVLLVAIFATALGRIYRHLRELEIMSTVCQLTLDSIPTPPPPPPTGWDKIRHFFNLS